MDSGTLKGYFKTRNSPLLSNAIIAFGISLILARFSDGLVYLILFIIVYELFLYFMTDADPEYWTFQTRIIIIIASLIGFAIGRLLIQQPVFF